MLHEATRVTDAQEPVAVVAVVHYGRSVLLIRRAATVQSPGWWGCPSGKVEPGEQQVEAVSREVMEELGLEVKPERCVWSTVSHDGRWATRWWTAHATGSRISPDHREIAEARWCSVDEICHFNSIFQTDVDFFTHVWPTLQIGSGV